MYRQKPPQKDEMVQKHMSEILCPCRTDAETLVSPNMVFKGTEGWEGRECRIRPSLCLLQKTQMKIF